MREKIQCLFIILIIILIFGGLYVLGEWSEKEKAKQRAARPFRDPDGCILVMFCYGDFWNGADYCGYITESDYDAFIKNELNSVMVFEHPYNDREIVIPVTDIQYVKEINKDDVEDYDCEW